MGEKLYEYMEITDLKDMLTKSSKQYAEKIAYELDDVKISYKELLNNVNCLGTALIDMGLEDKKIAVISENRYEWELAYLAIACGVRNCCANG